MEPKCVYCRGAAPVVAHWHLFTSYGEYLTATRYATIAEKYKTNSRYIVTYVPLMAQDLPDF